MVNINISIKEEAYSFLKSFKAKDKSFSDVILEFKKKNSKRFYLQPIQIVDGAFLFGGKRYGRPSHENAPPDDSSKSDNKTDSKAQ